MKTNSKFGICVISLVAILLSSCNPSCNECTQSLGYTYYPLEVGNYSEYDVTEQEFALGRAAVNRTIQWKESVVEKYNDAANQTIYKLIRYKRANETQKWQADSVMTVRLEVNQVVRNESGRDFVKLIFPPSERLSWNANVYNNLGEDKYEIKNLSKEYKFDNQRFDKTVTIVQQSDSTLVGQDKRTEVYAENVGLIYREQVNLQFCSSSPSCVGKAQVDFGFRRYIKLRKNGKE